MAEEARDRIPTPPGLPLIGNLLDVQDEIAVRAIGRILDIHGPIVRLNYIHSTGTYVGSVALVDELADEKRFWKAPVAALVGNERTRYGLFAAPSETSSDWQQAHRILMPAFGPLAIQEMFNEMHDIASQLVLKWARMGPVHKIPVTSDFTRLTLDSIALCAMDYRFNSFYQDEMHPFVKAMNHSFQARAERNRIGPMIRKMMPWDTSAEDVKKDRQYMQSIAQELVQTRRNNPTDKKDLLNAMVHGKDPKTGDSMDDALIGANMVTFLVAGHETTSGLLSFAMLELLKCPEAYFKVQQEVDAVLGKEKMNVEHLKDLKYINAVLRETLRLNPTVPAFARKIRDDNPNEHEFLLGGQYAVNRGDSVMCITTNVHRDPKVYGEDADHFKPERMLDDAFARLPKGAWKPFGTGMRSCIGRAFAWQEAQMALAILFQTFNFRLDDPAYEKRIKQSLTLKPDGLFMHATLREGISATSLQESSTGAGNLNGKLDSPASRADSGVDKGEPMLILYGSNTGTCQSLAQKLSINARSYGFNADVHELNAGVGVLPKDRPVVIIAASYEGQPTDNADQFVGWLEQMTSKREELSGVKYAVFGCGHSDWHNTFQRIPTLIDDAMKAAGAKQLVERGLTDASKGDIPGDFDAWADHTFWPAVAHASEGRQETSTALDVEMKTQDRNSYLRQDVQAGKVVNAKRLTADGEPEKRHLEIKLPEGMEYHTGDYLAVLPLNPSEQVERAMKHFKIRSDATMNIKPGAATFLPTGVAIAVRDVLQGFVELSQPATRKDIQACEKAASDPVEKAAIGIFVDKEGYSDVVAQRVSLLDMICEYPSIEITFSSFIAMLPPLRPRHYSISSSSLKDLTTCTVTYGVINEVARSGIGRYVGVASAYLASLTPGDEVLVSVRSTNKFFRLPADPDQPIIMFGAGTGLAPFRGFIEERAMQVTAGRNVAPGILWMGCCSETKDRLYAEEMDEWAKCGAVDVRYAYSQEPEKSAGCKYVQDRVIHDKEDVLRLWNLGAKSFTCGSPAVSQGLSEVAKKLLAERLAARGETVTEEKLEEFFQKLRNERFVVDVFD